MYEGGCLCGALRFSAAVRPIDMADDLPRHAESEPGAG